MSAAAKFTDSMLAVIRQRLFRDVADKQWWEHEATVRQAILEPARYLQERGAALPGSRYRQILMTCIITIEEHANRAQIRRMSYYLLHAVQEHMKHQGDRYYEEGKTPRGISLMVNPALKAMRGRPEAIALTDTLAAAAGLLSARSTRRNASRPKSTQRELF